MKIDIFGISCDEIKCSNIEDECGYLFTYNKALELILNYKNYILNESTGK